MLLFFSSNANLLCTIIGLAYPKMLFDKFEPQNKQHETCDCEQDYMMYCFWIHISKTYFLVLFTGSIDCYHTSLTHSGSTTTWAREIGGWYQHVSSTKLETRGLTQTTPTSPTKTQTMMNYRTHGGYKFSTTQPKTLWFRIKVKQFPFFFFSFFAK